MPTTEDTPITTGDVLFNWAVVCTANFAGAVGLAAIVFLSGHASLNGGATSVPPISLKLGMDQTAGTR